MQETLTFPTLGSPPRFTFPELHFVEHNSAYCSELSSSTSTPFVSAPSSPTRSKGFYFSAPTSPSWAQRTLLSQDKQGLHLPYWPLHTQQNGSPVDDPFHMQDSSCQSINSWSQLQTVHLQRKGDIEHQDSSNFSDKTEYQASSNGSHSSLQPDHTRGSINWAQQSLQQAEYNSSSSRSLKSLQITHHERNSSWAPQSLQTEHHSSSPALPHKSYQTEHERSPNRARHSLETEHISTSSSSHKSLQTHHGRSPSCNLNHYPQPIITDFADRTALKRLQVEDTDASYSRQGFYASAVPFSWEEKPGTPKARSVTSEASNGEDDSPSNLLSGSSEFEFSARFSELEDPPMSPTPISSTFHSFKHQYAYGSPSRTHKQAYGNPDMPSDTANEQQIWPLRLPPRLDSPVSPTKQHTKNEVINELKHSHGSQPSLSAPQSPRSPRKFDIIGAWCRISSPVDAVFDPFLAAMEKSMAKNGDDLANGKGPKKDTNRFFHGHHRRSQSLSPLRVFHWDDHSAKSNSSSNSSMDEVKNKHPIQREINARHSAGATKGFKRWSLKGFLHRKSVSGGESVRHSNTSGSLRSSGRESCSSSGKGEVPMDVSYVDDKVKGRGENSPIKNNPSMLSSMPSNPPILSPSSSNNSSREKLNSQKSNKGPYALHYGMQRAHTEDLRKKTFLPYRQGLLGCLGLSSKSYRALATLSKPLQPVS